MLFYYIWNFINPELILLYTQIYSDNLSFTGSYNTLINHESITLNLIVSIWLISADLVKLIRLVHTCIL